MPCTGHLHSLWYSWHADPWLHLIRLLVCSVPLWSSSHACLVTKVFSTVWMASWQIPWIRFVCCIRVPFLSWRTWGQLSLSTVPLSPSQYIYIDFWTVASECMSWVVGCYKEIVSDGGVLEDLKGKIVPWHSIQHCASSCRAAKEKEWVKH